MGRWLRRLLLTAVLLAVVAAGGIGWSYSSEILVPEAPATPGYETQVTAVSSDQVTLTATEPARRPGVWGLRFADGYAQAGDVVGAGVGTVTRRLRRLGDLPVEGQGVHVDGYAYPEDPAEAGFDFPVQEVGIEGPLGRYPAWLAGGDQHGDAWAIHVHGRGARRSECFRQLDVFNAAGIPSLCVSYRNDADAPPSPDGLYHQGDTEWQDVEAAIDFAQAQGARDIVLVGYSMGGQITANFLRRSPDAGAVVAVVWDSPLLDWTAALGMAAQDRGVPSWAVPLGMFASELRADLHYDELDQIAAADDFDVPILLFHGSADATVPVGDSDEFAAARPDLVTYERVQGAGHVECWNADPQRYERVLAGFLDQQPGGG
ncbi:MAG: alpha/beta fold hydrolase [Euzebyales bacterium]|nr:alpha/beta fold hydrolase [Euzebyales bacterium]